MSLLLKHTCRSVAQDIKNTVGVKPAICHLTGIAVVRYTAMQVSVLFALYLLLTNSLEARLWKTGRNIQMVKNSDSKNTLPILLLFSVDLMVM